MGTAWLVAIGLSIAAASTATNAQWQDREQGRVARALPLEDPSRAQGRGASAPTGQPAAPESDPVAPLDHSSAEIASGNDGTEIAAEPTARAAHVTDRAIAEETDDADLTDDANAADMELAIDAVEVEDKLDEALRDVIDRGDRSAQRVIVRTRPGDSSAVRAAVEQSGDRVVSEHPFVGALTVDVHGDDIAELAAHPGVERLSLDEVYEAVALPPHSSERTNPSGATASVNAPAADHQRRQAFPAVTSAKPAVAASAEAAGVGGTPAGADPTRAVPSPSSVSGAQAAAGAGRSMSAVTALVQPQIYRDDTVARRAGCGTQRSSSTASASEWRTAGATAAGIVTGNHFVLGNVETCQGGKSGRALWGSPPEGPPVIQH